MESQAAEVAAEIVADLLAAGVDADRGGLHEGSTSDAVLAMEEQAAKPDIIIAYGGTPAGSRAPRTWWAAAERVVRHATVPVFVARLTDQRRPTLGDRLHGGAVTADDLETLADKLYFDREPGGDAYVRFWALLLFAVIIATGGVLTDSTAVVIGAMIVAPLMTPIMASALRS